MSRSAGDRLLWSQARAHRGVLALGGAATLTQQLAMLALPWCIQRALDQGVTPLSVRRTVLWSALVSLVAVAFLLGGMGGQWWSGLAANRIAHSLRGELVARVATVDRPGLARFGRGDLVMRVTRDVEMIRRWIQSLALWVRVIVTVVVVLPAIGLLDPLLLVIGVITIPLVGLANAFFPGRYEAANELLSDAHGTRADAVEDLLAASAAVRGIGGEQVLVRRHHAASREVTTHTLRVARISALWSAVPPAVPRFAIAAGLGVGGTAALNGGLTVGGLVAFISWMTTLTLAIAIAVDLMAGRGQARVAVNRIAEVLDTPGIVDDPADAVTLPTRGTLHAGSLVVRRDGRRLLGPVDLWAEPGEFVAVTGPTGCGKTTLARLLCRLDDPDEGLVSFGGVDLRLAAHSHVLSRIGLVPQRPLVLSGTIADNLRLGRDISVDGLRAACRVAAIDDFVMGLPDRYDTVVGERGSTLSGGQGQRLALARGLLGGPDVLVLDDVTSAVDAVTEAMILERLRAWAPGTTLVVISHRPAVLAAADRVVTLEPAPAAVTSGPAGSGGPGGPGGPGESRLAGTGGHRG
ncbi:ABC transporter ATP-binding protein [Frankia sp. CiP3]|uniref:ABC transporter ATP-binding protein n=1 Tax=Frankia sp. CiP3 TaxID=2880971 RepID=UPI001EF451A1|nr:ABC transporter ATP-binding protein [Frankia sp. CiP3]